MKKYLVLSIILSGFIFGSCQKEEAVDVPGNIPGMGDNNSALEVKPISLPENVAVVGEIRGYVENNKSASTFPNYKIFGGSGEFIRLEYTVKNINNIAVTVFFPAGTIFKSSNLAYQHGILLQWTWFCIPANSQRTIVLYLYCINKGKNNSDASNTYQLAGQTTSRPILNLLNMLKLKKVNHEFFNHLKSASADDYGYSTISEQMQKALWALTNDGTEVPAEIKAYINALPELETAKIPEKLINDNAELPLFFEEYVAE